MLPAIGALGLLAVRADPASAGIELRQHAWLLIASMRVAYGWFFLRKLGNAILKQKNAPTIAGRRVVPITARVGIKS